jgi:hypothetical protein
MVEETSAASHSLAAEAHQLAQLVSKFNVGEMSAQEMAASAAARTREVPRPQPAAPKKASANGKGNGAHMPPPVKANGGAVRTLTAGNAALAAMAAPDQQDDNWQEF